jgi:hypothetical protein
MLSVLLPQPNTVPSIDQLRHLSQSATGSEMAMPMCVNECVLFINAPLLADPHLERQFEHCTYCPVCDEPRLANDRPRHVRQFNLFMHENHLLMLNPIQVHYHLSITAQLFALLDRPEVQLALQARIGILNDTVHLGIPESSTWSEILQSPRLRAKILELDPSFADSWTSVVLQLCTVPPPPHPPPHTPSHPCVFHLPTPQHTHTRTRIHIHTHAHVHRHSLNQQPQTP